MEVLDRREWPRTELDIQVARAALFAVQILRRDLIAAWREDVVDEACRIMSSISPEAESDSRAARPS